MEDKKCIKCGKTLPVNYPENMCEYCCLGENDKRKKRGKLLLKVAGGVGLTTVLGIIKYLWKQKQ